MCVSCEKCCGIDASVGTLAKCVSLCTGSRCCNCVLRSCHDDHNSSLLGCCPNAFLPQTCPPAHGSLPFPQGSTAAEDAVGTGTGTGFEGFEGFRGLDEGAFGFSKVCPGSELLSYGRCGPVHCLRLVCVSVIVRVSEFRGPIVEGTSSGTGEDEAADC